MANKLPAKHKGGYRQINKAVNICVFEDYLEAQLSHLPELADIEQISPRVIRVLGQNAGKVSSDGYGRYTQSRINGSIVYPPGYQHLYHRNRA